MAETDRRRNVIRVLVADGFPDAAETLSLLLGMCGYESSFAVSTSQALELAGTFHPHAFVIDIGSQGLDGFALLTQLRCNAESRRAVAVAITAYYGVDFEARCRRAHFDCVLQKPVLSETLDTEIRARVLLKGFSNQR